MSHSFHNLYHHDFARVAVGVPRCRVADPLFNAAQTIALAEQAAGQGAVLVAFPELGLSAYSCDDLFHQRALLDGSTGRAARNRKASVAGRRGRAFPLPLSRPASPGTIRDDGANVWFTLGLLSDCCASFARGDRDAR